MTGLSLSATKKRSARWRRLNSSVVYIGNFLMTLLFIAPWLWSFGVSLLPATLLFTNPPVVFHFPLDFSSYQAVLQFEDGRFVSAMQTSAGVAVATSLIVVVLSCLAGYAFARLKFIGKELLFILILGTMMFPFTAVLIPLFSIISQLKLLNNPLSLVVLYTTFELPFCIFLFRNAFESIPGALRDAALIDGCHEFDVLRRIMLPLALPAAATVIIYSLYHSWNEFTAALIFLTNENQTTVPVVLSYMALSGRWGTKDNVLMAGSVVSFLPVLVIFLVFQRFFVQGLISGSTKG